MCDLSNDTIISDLKSNIMDAIANSDPEVQYDSMEAIINLMHGIENKLKGLEQAERQKEQYREWWLEAQKNVKELTERINKLETMPEINFGMSVDAKEKEKDEW